MHNRLLVTIPAAFLYISAAAPGAAPLEFAGFTADTVKGNSVDVHCHTISPNRCDWDRQTLGGMLLIKPIASFNKVTGKIQSIDFTANKIFESRAVETFTAKYGPPNSDKIVKKVNKFGGPYEERTIQWDFEGRDYVNIYRDEEGLFVIVAWRQNLPPIEKPKVDF